MSQAVDQHQHKLSHGVQPSSTHIQDTVVGVKVEGVAVQVACQLRVCRDAVGEQDGHWSVTAACSNNTGNEAAKLVDDERPGVQRADVQGREVLVSCPLGITVIDVAICKQKRSMHWG